MRIPFGHRSTPLSPGLAAALLASAVMVPAYATPGNPDGMKAHIAAAEKVAASHPDLKGPLNLCKTATGGPASSFMANYKKWSAEAPLPPMQVFDNLYFLGLGHQDLGRHHRRRRHG
jgi:hypothetical protein